MSADGNSTLAQAEGLSSQFDDMFSDDLIAVEGLRFDNLLERAATDVSDTEALTELTASFDRAKARGDFLQIQQMAMTLGAIACMHDHLQHFSSQIAQDYLRNGQEEHFRHTHTSSADSKEKKKAWPFGFKKKSKNVKAQSLFRLFFALK